MDMKILPSELILDPGNKIDRPLKQSTQNADKTNAAVKKAAREFEALFASMMIKSMRSTVGKDSLTGGGHGEEIFRSMLDQEYATAMTANGGLGLARMIEKQLQNDTRGKK